MNVIENQRQNSDQYIINLLKETDVPLIIWGGGRLAEIYLKRYDFLNIREVFSDFKGDLGRIINGYNIVDFSYVQNKYSSFNILIAHGHPNFKDKYLNLPCVENIFYLFDIHNFGMSLDVDFYKENEIRLNSVFNKLEDDISKISYENYLNSRLNNNWNYIEKMIIDSNEIPQFLNLGNEEIIIDCGAFDGDSLINYKNKIGCWKKYYAIEPDNKNHHKLKQNTDTFDKVEYLNFGVWSEETILKFEINDDKSSLIYDREKNENLDNFEINVDKIDNIAHDATFIKMDVEGAEYQALIGAVNIIKSNKPKLAISIYHNQSDLFRIFELISQMRNDYTFYFRLHNKLGVDAMLYAV